MERAPYQVSVIIIINYNFIFLSRPHGDSDDGIVFEATSNFADYIDEVGKGIGFLVLYPPKCSHNLPPLAGLYTRKPFQSPGGYSRATGSI